MTPEEKEMMWLIVKRDQKQKAIMNGSFAWPGKNAH